ncbi:hypothetical protein [Haloarcula nitratireducens]|uniref:Uncharacterized protein n=1 Tax=Haloarcula nitratireducens TaxID=2487749 RepID=A0AAW4P927_9EURY|nr:hypothetical protein [Halomicroarcula nitratireducens]MBX0293787.1 hypothetical protein [Halomicroarcula nitratireducens]
MAKVNIGLRGWRFDEEVLNEEGRIRPLATLEPEVRQRLLVLADRVVDPCDACWLEYGDGQIEECNVAEVIYGEPGGEVVLCSVHEPDFLYWFREAGGDEYAGDLELQEAFHQWFLDGNRAPDGYEGLEHVDENPTALPDAPTRSEAVPSLEEELQELDDEEKTAMDLDFSDLDV